MSRCIFLTERGCAARGSRCAVMSSTLHPGSCRRPSPSGLSEEGELLKCSHKDTKAKLETKLDVTEAEPQVSVITAVNMCFHHIWNFLKCCRWADASFSLACVNSIFSERPSLGMHLSAVKTKRPLMCCGLWTCKCFQ